MIARKKISPASGAENSKEAAYQINETGQSAAPNPFNQTGIPRNSSKYRSRKRDRQAAEFKANPRKPPKMLQLAQARRQGITKLRPTPPTAMNAPAAAKTTNTFGAVLSSSLKLSTKNTAVPRRHRMEPNSSQKIPVPKCESAPKKSSG